MSDGRAEILKADGLYHVYDSKAEDGNVVALRGLHVSVYEGEAVAVVGPSGSGKSTLIKILATLSPASSGKIWINGLDSQEYSHHVRRNIGVITHDMMLYSHLTGLENLLFYGRKLFI